MQVLQSVTVTRPQAYIWDNSRIRDKEVSCQEVSSSSEGGIGRFRVIGSLGEVIYLMIMTESSIIENLECKELV